MTWEDIRYRDFYDVPRIFVFESAGKTYLAECRYSEGVDDYERAYTLFEMPPLSQLALDASWENLSAQAIRKLGEIAVTKVVFDKSKRRQVNTDVFTGML